MRPERPAQRRSFFGEAPKQLRLVSGWSAIPLLTLVGSTLAVAFFGARVLEEARSLDASGDSLMPFAMALVALILSAVALVALQALRYGQRTAGPSYRMLQTLERVRRGDLAQRIRLREGDDLQELAHSFNRLLDSVEGRIADEARDPFERVGDRVEVSEHFGEDFEGEEELEEVEEFFDEEDGSFEAGELGAREA